MNDQNGLPTLLLPGWLLCRLPVVSKTTSATPSSEDRIFTVPNLFSMFRLLLVPVFVWLLFGRDNRLQAALLLAAIGSTDWVDGWYARKFDQVSTLGKILDPAADRILLGVGAVSIIIDGSIPRWLGVVIVVREIVVSLAVLALAAGGAQRIDVKWSGKAATMGLMIAFPLFLLSKSTVSGADVFRVAAWIVVIPSVLMSFVATAGYLPVAKTALAEGRANRKKANPV
jgi:cardiolipin synthase (CMP-forming)